jgi:hypothetical protein
MSFTTDKLFPYVVPSSYLQHQAPGPEGLTYPLGHGLHVTLVQDLAGAVTNIREEELRQARLTPEQAHTQALENLGKVVRSGAISMSRYNGPRGLPFVIFFDHWLSATVALLPDLYQMAAANLGAASICACLPHRDTLLLFPAADQAFRTEMLAVIKENESDGAKPLSFGLFLLENGRLTEFAGG